MIETENGEDIFITSAIFRQIISVTKIDPALYFMG